jgi:putative ABC transport system substrate-binding protein
MRRRYFITLISGSVAAWPLRTWAQQPAGRIAHIAYFGALSPSNIDPRQIEQFQAGLIENGLIEGQNITVEYFWAEGSSERTRQLAGELGHRELDLIVTAGPQLVRALLATGTKTPIVFAVLNDPVADGFVKNLAQPGANVTGLSMAGTDMETKRVEVLKDAVPRLTKIMILHDPSMGSTAVEEVQTGARKLKLDFILAEANAPEKFADAFAGAVAQGVNGVTAMASPFLNFQRKALIALAEQYHLPSIWENSAYVRDGGLLSYGPSFPDMYRRSAGYVAKIILAGQKPADLPVQQPIKFELAVNVKTAKVFGLTIPETLLLRADEVIE